MFATGLWLSLAGTPVSTTGGPGRSLPVTGSTVDAPGVRIVTLCGRFGRIGHLRLGRGGVEVFRAVPQELFGLLGPTCGVVDAVVGVAESDDVAHQQSQLGVMVKACEVACRAAG